MNTRWREVSGGQRLIRSDVFLHRLPLQWRDFNPYSVLVSNFRQADANTGPSADARLVELSAWLRETAPKRAERIVPASGDASFRRYFRVFSDDDTWIAMDAPPPMEDVQRFADVAELLRTTGVTVPAVFALDASRGFMLLSDLGDVRYLDHLSSSTADRLYRSAIEALVRFQSAIDIGTCQRPHYEEALLRRELNLFREWFLEGLLGLTLSPAQTLALDRTGSLLIRSALDQPRVLVHRDYHSRNLMVRGGDQPGILDFQDAVVGPISYDLVSLLRDCYVAWPEARVDHWVGDYLAQAIQAGLLPPSEAGRFRRWFDFMGMQRHLKAVGIFSRLNLRDGKPGYLADIPRTLDYVSGVSRRYPEFAEFAAFLDSGAVTSMIGENLT